MMNSAPPAVSSAEGGALACRLIFDARSIETTGFTGIGAYAESLLLALGKFKTAMGSAALLTIVGLRESRLREIANDPRLNGLVETLSWGEGLGILGRRPRFFWSTLLLAGMTWHRLGRWMGLFERSSIPRESSPLFWIAPDNIDRPLVVPFAWKRSVTVVQIFHDLIPLRFPNNANRWLRFQIRMLARPQMQHILYVAASSFAKRSADLRLPGLKVAEVVLGNRVSTAMIEDLKSFCAVDPDRLWGELARLLPGLFSHGGVLVLDRKSEGIHNHRPFFFLGVGREEPYKQWQEAVATSKLFSRNLGKDVWFLHVCPHPGSELNSQEPQILTDNGRCLVFPNKRLVVLSGLTVRELTLLYRTAQALLHPSLMEGFGRPLAEAYLAGLPVFARKSVGFCEVSSAFSDQRGLNFFDDVKKERFSQWVQGAFASVVDSADRQGNVSASRIQDTAVQNLLYSTESLAQEFSNLLVQEQVLP